MSKNSSTKMNSLHTESTISLLAERKTSSNGNKRWFFDRAIAVMIGGASIRMSMVPRSVASSEAISLPYVVTKLSDSSVDAVPVPPRLSVTAALSTAYKSSLDFGTGLIILAMSVKYCLS